MAPPAARKSPSLKLALATPPLHSTVSRYQGPSSDVQNALHRLPPLLEKMGFRQNEQLNQNSQPHTKPPHTDGRQVWSSEGQHLFVFSRFFPDDPTDSQGRPILSGLAIVAHTDFQTPLKEALLA